MSPILTQLREDETYYYEQQEVSLEELKMQLGAAIEADPNLRILIRSDAQTRYKVNEKVITACAEVGANDLIYAAFEE